MKLNQEIVMAAEKSVLGAMMLDAPAARKAAARLREQDFTVAANQAIFKAARGLLADKKPVDFLTVSDLVEHDEHVARIGGLDYLLELNSFVPSAVNADYYIDQVAENGRENRLNHEVPKIMRDVDPSYPRLMELLRHEQENAPRPENELDMAEAIEAYLKELADPPKNGLFRTGFPTLDNATGGLPRTSLSCLKAMQRVGKTALALNMAVRNVRDKHRVLVVSMEMSIKQVFDRLAAAEARVNYTDIFRRRTDSEQNGKIATELVDLVSGNRLYVLDNVRTVSGIVAEIDRLRPDVVFVDYLQKIIGEGKKDNRHHEIEELISRLKMAAMDYDCHICALSQVNAQGDAKESRSIEEGSDIVMHLERPELDKVTGLLDSKGWLRVTKNKYGPECRLSVELIGPQQRFTELRYA